MIWELLLGLAIALIIGRWRQNKLHAELNQILAILDTGGAEGNSLPILSRLRLGVTIFKRQTQQLEIQLQNYRYLLEQLPLGYLVVDAENQLLCCNQQARELLYLSNWEPNQKRFLLEVVRSYELDRLIEQTRTAQKSTQKEWIFYPQTIDRQPGERLTLSSEQVSLRGYAVPLPDREIAVFLENLQSLVEISQQRDRTVSDLAHELRTPLTSIRLVTETLLKRLQPPERGWVEKMLQETNRLIDLAQHFLELNHLEQDPSQCLTIEPVELKSLIFSAWNTLEPFAQSKQLELIYTGSELVQLEGDRARLTQVFLNLLDNSIKYSPKNGKVEVEVKVLDPSKLQVNVIDSGNGFTPTDLPYVFDRLFRTDLSRQKHSTDLAQLTTGNGLGLAIARQIILAHRGTIKAMNHPQTQGAWLQIELPRFWLSKE
ncbi:sensor histidine kinase [Merismopedia glauca]|uniref:histidine kinase n=1 Tax=Merismopedia glauca CCAP 1448/3 TaxID=1296344 RepID=A0A2T1BWW7_9CYAN|nr:PAS domain-containing sensor histidine kinase [Merismopedia glauca]PSB00414.1 histidine kinase [Merismopedia glauca CCAP 1448/3]